MLFGWQGKRQLDKAPDELARRCTKGTLLLIHPIAGKVCLLGYSGRESALLLPFYRFFDLLLPLLYLLFYLRAPPLYRFLSLVLYPLHLLVHLLLYLLLHSPTRGCTEHRSGSDPEENAQSSSHPSPYLTVDRAYEGFSDAVRIRHEGLMYPGAYSRICGIAQKRQLPPYSLYCR
jgi:hypothetical protein